MFLMKMKIGFFIVIYSKKQMLNLYNRRVNILYCLVLMYSFEKSRKNTPLVKRKEEWRGSCDYFMSVQKITKTRKQRSLCLLHKYTYISIYELIYLKRGRDREGRWDIRTHLLLWNFRQISNFLLVHSRTRHLY